MSARSGVAPEPRQALLPVGCTAVPVQAALQDHFSRSLHLPGALQRRPAQRPGQPLTLAQKQNLVHRPPSKLTEADWAAVRNKARLREQTECPVCQEPFKDSDQVLFWC